MKIYAIADIHGTQYRINEAYEMITINNPDIVCVCGDITQFGPGEMATLLLDQLKGPVITVTGNIDPADVIEGIKQSHAENIQHQRYEFKGVSFLGLNAISERQTTEFYSNPEHAPLLKNLDVLVTHVPPYGFQDTVFLGKHAGNKTLTEIIKTVKPRLVLSGHIHENPGFTQTDETTIVNCSMGKRGKGAIIQFDTEILVEMLD